MIKPVLVIGGGVAGMSAARELSQRDKKVILAEEGTCLGGWVGHYSCKAVDVCQKCGACLARLLAEEVTGDGGIELMLGWRAAAVYPSIDNGDYLVVMVRNGETREIETAGVIVSSGFKPFDARLWGEYGYGRCPGVITSLDLERIWREAGDLKNWSAGLKKAAFIQCVGSRTNRPGGTPFCSRVCCGNALRSARRMLWELPDLKVDIFHMDLQSGGKLLSEASRNPAINLVRAIPSLVYQLPGQAVIITWESAEGRKNSGEYDMVVLSVGMVKNSCPTVSSVSGKPGLILAGTASGPMDIRESIRRGRLAAVRLLTGNSAPL